MKLNPKIKDSLFFIFFTLIILTLSVVSIYKPDYNWDVLTYTASVYSLESTDTNTIHKNTYEIVKNSIPEKSFIPLISSNKYREEMYQCARCFYQQLSFIKIRALYITLIYCFYKLNINIVKAPFIISSLSCFFIGLIIFFWIKSLIKIRWFSFIISALLVMSPFMLNSAVEASSNALSGLIIFSALFSFYKRKFYLFLGLMLLSVFARPDNLILIFLFSAVLIINNKNINKIYPVVTIILAIIFTFLIDRWANTFGWAILFEHSFGDRLVTPADYNSQFNLIVYFKAYLKWAVLFKFSVIGIQSFIVAIIFYLKSDFIKKIRYDTDLLMLSVVALSIILHYLLFPLMEDKYFIAQYLFIDIIFIKTIVEKFEMNKNKILDGN